MQPYVILKGLSEDRIDKSATELFKAKRQLRLSIDA